MLHEDAQQFEAAREAARAGDAVTSLRIARATAAARLRTYLEAAGVSYQVAGDDVVSLLEAAAAREAYFGRLRPEARVLVAPEREATDCDAIIEALKEIRMLADCRTGLITGPAPTLVELAPGLEDFVVHSTTSDRARGVFGQGALYSHNRCRQRGLLDGSSIGVELLGDPLRWLDLVTFSIPNGISGEIVANSQRKGTIDCELTDDYQPSVRLFFRRRTLEALPGHDDDGIHSLMVKDEVSLDHLAYAVFPDPAARDAALAAVADAGRREALRPRCLVAPADAGAIPAAYVSATNTLVAERVCEDGSG
jgi:hypothetical protein